LAPAITAIVHTAAYFRRYLFTRIGTCFRRYLFTRSAFQIFDFRISVFTRIYLGSGHRPSIVSVPSSALRPSIGARIEESAILIRPSRFGHALPFAAGSLQNLRPSRQSLSTIEFFTSDILGEVRGLTTLFTGRAMCLCQQ
jgi:hypothetical protein